MAERPEDLNLPTAVITRLIKDSLPEGVNVSKDARLAISKAASVFVLYATSCANNFAMQSKRKTISGPDVIEAVNEMEFEKFAEPLKKSLEAFRKEQKEKKEAAERKKKAKEQDTSKDEEDVEMEAEEEQEGGEEDDAANEVVILDGDSDETGDE